MSKKIGFLVLAGILVLAPVSMARASVESCIAGVIHDRDTSIIAENNGYNSTVNTLINIRMGHLQNAWLTINDQALRKIENKATWDNFRDTKSAVKSSHYNALYNIWQNYFAYRAQCKNSPSPNFDTDGSSDADLD